MSRNIKRIPRFIDKFRRLWMKMTPHPRQARPDGGVFARFAHRLLLPARRSALDRRFYPTL